MNQDTIKRLEKLVAEADGAHKRQPKALWSDRTYLSPRAAADLRALLAEVDQLRQEVEALAEAAAGADL